MNETLTAEQKSAVLASLQRYVQEHFDLELNDLQGTLLLDFIMKEIAPFAYNRGVEDARAFMAARLDDLPGTCFEQGLTYWEMKPRTSTRVRRKTDG